MSEFQVEAEYSYRVSDRITVSVTADSEYDITEEMVEKAVWAEVGKHIGYEQWDGVTNVYGIDRRPAADVNPRQQRPQPCASS